VPGGDYGLSLGGGSQEPSTVQIGLVVKTSFWRDQRLVEQQRPNPGRQAKGVKRAILPAAISESVAKDGYSPRPEVESSHKGDDVAGISRKYRDR